MRMQAESSAYFITSAIFFLNKDHLKKFSFYNLTYVFPLYNVENITIKSK